jgi:hypothetical protein
MKLSKLILSIVRTNKSIELTVMLTASIDSNLAGYVKENWPNRV